MRKDGRQLDVRVRGSVYIDNCERAIDVSGCPLCLIVRTRPCNVGGGHVVLDKSGDAVMGMVDSVDEREAVDVDVTVGFRVGLLQQNDRDGVSGADVVDNVAFGSGQAFHVELEDVWPTSSKEAGNGVDTTVVVRFRVGFGSAGGVRVHVHMCVAHFSRWHLGALFFVVHFDR